MNARVVEAFLSCPSTCISFFSRHVLTYDCALQVGLFLTASLGDLAGANRVLRDTIAINLYLILIAFEP